MQRIQGKGSRYSYYCNQCDTTFRSLAEAEDKHKTCKPNKQHGKKDNTSDSADDER